MRFVKNKIFFKGLMWFAYTNNFASWHVLKIDQVKEIMDQNKQKIKVSALEDFAIEIVTEQETTFSNAMGQESLTRFDQPKRKKSNNNRNKKPNPNGNPSNQPKIAGQNENRGNQENKGANPNNPGNPNNRNNKNRNNKKPQDKRPIIIKKNEDPT